jgi:hypothetical protein
VLLIAPAVSDTPDGVNPTLFSVLKFAELSDRESGLGSDDALDRPSADGAIGQCRIGRCESLAAPKSN